MAKAMQTATLLLMTIFSISCSRSFSYVAMLKALAGTPYLTLDCQRYIEAARGSRGHCGARGMWTGCNSQAVVIAEFATKRSIDPSKMRAGDVLDFHGVHVVAFVGDGFMDSDAKHNGVGRMDPRTTSDSDLWFAGPVRVIRWN